MKTQKMKPILFSGQMVRALLSGRKTVTRRVIKQKYIDDALSSPARKSNPDIPDEKFIQCLCNAPYEPGDILWVRETWRCYEARSAGRLGSCIIEYKADGAKKTFEKIIALPTASGKWRPSIYMPRAAARIFLRVKDVRAKRLQEVGETDIRQEGVIGSCFTLLRNSFANLWNSLNAKRDGGAYAWAKNPWVWVIEFERVEEHHGE